MGKSDKKDKKAEKERIKAQETPEERYARRLAKKRKKHGEDAEFFGYKNDDNRFGDANLQEQFVWRKKIDKMVATGHDPRDLSREAQRDKKKALREEVERLKASREEREQEKQMMEEERERLNREREALHFAEWERKEEEFHRQQAKTRTEIRIAKGRARPIDKLANNLLLDDNFDMEMREPYKVFRGLSNEELNELCEDMQQQAVGEFSEYWDSLLIVCRDELQLRESKQDHRGVADHGVHKAVQSDLDMMLQGKSCNELNVLAEEINGHMESGGGGDVEYWESLMKRLKVHRAKAVLRDISQDLLRKRLKKLQCIDGGVLDGGEARKPSAVVKQESARSQQEFVVPTVPAPDLVEEQGDWSPELLHEVHGEDLDFVMDEDEDWKEIKALRAQIEAREQSKVSTDLLAAPAHSKIGPTEEELYQSVAGAAEGDDDSVRSTLFSGPSVLLLVG